jgi:uracil-DNA glycosylase
MKINEIIIKAKIIRDFLKFNDDSIENQIDDTLLPIPPYKISNQIQLIIIGQDPTIRNESRRENIDTTLNLDKGGSLRNYIEKICSKLNIGFENIYGTNVFKYFYKNPPADTIKVLQAHLSPNLKLLKEELSIFPGVPIITLGEPVLKLLSKDLKIAKMTYYWDYNLETKISNGNLKYCQKEDNLLERNFFPIPHQPSMSKEFYAKYFDDYLEFIRKNYNT